MKILVLFHLRLNDIIPVIRAIESSIFQPLL